MAAGGEDELLGYDPTHTTREALERQTLPRLNTPSGFRSLLRDDSDIKLARSEGDVRHQLSRHNNNSGISPSQHMENLTPSVLRRDSAVFDAGRSGPRIVHPPPPPDLIRASIDGPARAPDSVDLHHRRTHQASSFPTGHVNQDDPYYASPAGSGHQRPDHRAKYPSASLSRSSEISADAFPSFSTSNQDRTYYRPHDDQQIPMSPRQRPERYNVGSRDFVGRLDASPEPSPGTARFDPDPSHALASSAANYYRAHRDHKLARITGLSPPPPGHGSS